MGIKKDFTQIHNAIADVKKRIHDTMDDVGRRAVQSAVERGDYHNVTGHLRASNKYEVTKRGLRIYNTADYASDVEARGYNVITFAALEAMAELEKEFS